MVNLFARISLSRDSCFVKNSSVSQTMLERTLTKRGWVSILMCSTAALLCADLAKAQTSFQFQNLDFESAVNLPPTPSGPVLTATSNALSGWSVSDAGGNPDTQVFYNGVSGGTALVTLIGTSPAGPFYPALYGNYSATLDAGQISGGGLGSVSLYHTGTVPTTARSLTFLAAFDVAALQLSFGGTNGRAGLHRKFNPD